MSISATKSGSLRPMTFEDLDQIFAWRNHPEVRRYMYTTHEIAHDEHRRWFERAAQDADRYLLVFEQESKPQGFINLHLIAPGGIADWGFYAAPDAPKGTGRRLGCAALDFAFAELGLHKVCGQALDFNERSIRFHHNLGFRQEGTLREQHFDGFNYRDILCFGLLAADWSTHA